MTPRMSVLLSALLSFAAARAAELNALSDLKVVPTGSGAQVVVVGSRAPTFTVFRLTEPDRLVVDVSGADATVIRGPHSGAGPISGVVASQFSDAQASIGRVLVALDQNTKYDVRPDGSRIVISIEGTSTAAAAAPPLPVQPSSPAPAVTEAADHLLASKVDERAVGSLARHLTSLRYSRDRLKIGADGEIAKYEIVSLADPPRLALDVYGVSLRAKVPSARSELVKEIRAGSHQGKVRLVLDMKNGTPEYRAVRTRRGMELVLSSVARVARSDEPSRSAAATDGGAAPLQDGELELD